MKPRTQLIRAVAVALLLSLAFVLAGGMPGFALAEENGNAAGQPVDLSTLLDVPHRAQTASLSSLLAQAENSVEKVVHTEQELRYTLQTAPRGTTIVLGDDVALIDSDPLIVRPGQQFTLDLHGHTLSRAPGTGTSGTGNYRLIIIYVDATLSIVDVGGGGKGTITGGRSEESGGAIYNVGTLIMYGGTITGNRTSTFGGAVANYGTANFHSTRITNNVADHYGGGIYNDQYATLLFDGGEISNNSATDVGGGLCSMRSGGSCRLSGCTISGNKATNGDGGGIIEVVWDKSDESISSFSNVYLSGNTASGYGGGICAYPGTSDTNTKVMASITLDGLSRLEGNVAGREGGGIYLGRPFKAELANVTITNNKSEMNGGGIFVDGSEVGNLQMKDYAYVNGNFLGTGTDDSDEPSNVCFRRPDDVIAVTGPLSKTSNIAVTFDPSLLYRTVTKGYAENAKTTDASGNETEAIDPNGIFRGDGDHVAILKDGEVRVAVPVRYVDAWGNTQTIVDYEQVTSSFTGNTNPRGCFVVHQSVELAERPSIGAETDLIVLDGAVLDCKQGIEVPRRGSLTIYGQAGQSGVVTADARFLNYAAGIGSSEGRPAGKITVNGARVVAAGGYQGAGIGCGGNQSEAAHDNTSGPFILNRGYVEAFGGERGAGVGHGLSNYDDSEGFRTISEYASNFRMEIHGGTLVAGGGNLGPGIGTTNDAGFTLLVDGGEVSARGGTGGAGIGSARGYACYDESNLTFAGGKVWAVGGKDMPSIGCRDEDFDTYFDGNKLTFSGGIVECDNRFSGGYSASLDGKYEESAKNTMVLAGASELDAQRVLAKDRWTTMRASNYAYVRVGPCDHLDAVAMNDGGGLWHLECQWCQHEESSRGWPVHYDPGEGTGTMKDDFVISTIAGSGSFKLPTTATFVPPASKELAGWKIGNSLHEPGATITVNHEVTAKALWKTAGASEDVWSEPTYEWSSDYGSVTARRVSLHDPTHPETETVTTTSRVTTQPTCTERGVTTYTATFANPAFSTQEKTQQNIGTTGHVPSEQIVYDTILAPDCTNFGYSRAQTYCKNCGQKIHEEIVRVEPIGHEWGKPSYDWLGDNMVVTATRVCGHDGSHVESETVNASVTRTEPTCTEGGGVVYTASFANAAFQTQTKAVKLDALGHKWETQYSSTGDGRVHVKRTCSRCQQVEESSYQEEGHIHEMGLVRGVAATCTEPGTREHCVCVVCWKLFSNMSGNEELSSSDVVIPAPGHNWGEPTYTWSADYGSVVATRVCSHAPDGVVPDHEEAEAADTTSTVAREATCSQTGRVAYTATFDNTAFASQTREVDIPRTAHMLSETPTYENEVAATCVTDGSRDVVVRCSVCGAELLRERESIPGGHTWGAPTYTWSDDNTHVTAARVCGRDGSHVESETVQTVSKVEVGPTCTARGETTYAATFANQAFASQSKVVADIDPLGHTPGPAVRTVTVAATCTKPGTYSEEVRCARCGEVLSQANGTVSALGHDWGEWVVTKESTETEEGVETRTCRNDSSHVETRTIPKRDVQDQEKPTYRVVAGDGGVWTKGVATGLTFTFKRSIDDETTFGHFMGIRVDGVLVAPTNYDAVAGSVVVTLKPTYLETLSVGRHTFDALFDDGLVATAGFEVKDRQANPTGGGVAPGDVSGGGGVSPGDVSGGGAGVSPGDVSGSGGVNGTTGVASATGMTGTTGATGVTGTIIATDAAGGSNSTGTRTVTPATGDNTLPALVPLALAVSALALVALKGDV